MTELWTWGLIASLILLAVSTSIKTAQTLVTVKGLNDTIAELRKQIEVINQQFNEATQKQGELYAREKDKLAEEISGLKDQITALERKNYANEIAALKKRQLEQMAVHHRQEPEDESPLTFGLRRK